VYLSMSVSVEAVSALRAEGVNVSVFNVLRLAVGAFVDLVHTGQIDYLCVSTAGAVVLGEELVEGLHRLADSGDDVGLSVNLADDADSEVALVVCVVHVSEVFVDECVQEELVLNLGVAVVSLEQVHHFGDLDHEVRVNFALRADAEEFVFGHAKV